MYSNKESKMDDRIDRLVSKTVNELEKQHKYSAGVNTEKGMNLPGQQAIHKVLDELISIIFPGCHGHKPVREKDMKQDLLKKLLVLDILFV